MSVEILSYNKYKNSKGYRKYHNSVLLNMNHFGFTELCRTGIDTDKNNKAVEKSEDIVNLVIDGRGIKNGTVVWYRTKDLWGLPYLIIFHNNSEFST